MNSRRVRLAALLGFASLVLSVTGPVRAADPAGTPPASSAGRIRAAAREFLDSLTPDQRKQALFAADDPERKDWSNLPHTIHPRKGISFGELNPEQRVKAHHLIQAGLSSQGYLKASGIMQLDEVLLHLSGQDKAEKPMFGLRQYWLSFLGDPAGEQPWGWQLDGHHLALNFSVVGTGVATTPTFLGADPHEVRDGLHSGWRVLAAEDDQGLELMRALRPEQQKKAMLQPEAPGDVLTGPGKDKALPAVAGLPYGELDAAQQRLLRSLVEEYVHNYRHDLAHAQLERIEKAGWDKIHFGWAGPIGPSAPYYYRLHGPAVLIEFDNNYPPGRKAGPINHIHSVFRDPQKDYGEDLLQRHLRESHGQGRK